MLKKLNKNKIKKIITFTSAFIVSISLLGTIAFAAGSSGQESSPNYLEYQKVFVRGNTMLYLDNQDCSYAHCRAQPYHWGIYYQGNTSYYKWLSGYTKGKVWSRAFVKSPVRILITSPRKYSVTYYDTPIANTAEVNYGMNNPYNVAMTHKALGQVGAID